MDQTWTKRSERGRRSVFQPPWKLDTCGEETPEAGSPGRRSAINAGQSSRRKKINNSAMISHGRSTCRAGARNRKFMV